MYLRHYDTMRKVFLNSKTLVCALKHLQTPTGTLRMVMTTTHDRLVTVQYDKCNCGLFWPILGGICKFPGPQNLQKSISRPIISYTPCHMSQLLPHKVSGAIYPVSFWVTGQKLHFRVILGLTDPKWPKWPKMAKWPKWSLRWTLKKYENLNFDQNPSIHCLIHLWCRCERSTRA